MENKLAEAQLALCRECADQAVSWGQGRLILFLGEHGYDVGSDNATTVDAFLKSLGDEKIIDVTPRSIQGSVEPSYEFRIKHKGKLRVQRDTLKDSPVATRLAEKFRKLGETCSDIADLFDEA